MIEFVWPSSAGEWLAWCSAAGVTLYGIWTLFAPGSWLNNGRKHPNYRASVGGGGIGLGLAVLLLHPQPLLYLALGAVLLFTAIGRMVTTSLQGAWSISSLKYLIIEGLLAFFALSYALGYIR